MATNPVPIETLGVAFPVAESEARTASATFGPFANPHGAAGLILVIAAYLIRRGMARNRAPISGLEASSASACIGFRSPQQSLRQDEQPSEPPCGRRYTEFSK